MTNLELMKLRDLLKHRQLYQISLPTPLCFTATQELLDRPYINKRTGLDFVVMCVMGFILGLLSIPYCCLIDEWQALSMLLGCVGSNIVAVGGWDVQRFFLGGSIFLAAGTQGSPVRTEQIISMVLTLESNHRVDGKKHVPLRLFT